MKRISVTRQISTPAEVVFKVVGYPEGFQAALPHVLGMEFLTESKAGVGTRFRETRLMGKRETVDRAGDQGMGRE